MADLQRLRELAISPSLNERRKAVAAGAAGAAGEKKKAMAEKKPVLLVCLEGPIGVGKSTVLSEIEAMRLPNVTVLYERVEDWKAVDMTRADGLPTNMLGAMYVFMPEPFPFLPFSPSTQSPPQSDPTWNTNASGIVLA